MIALILTLVLAQQQLPQAPEGLRVREVVKLGVPDVDDQPVRVQPHPKTGRFYVLYKTGRIVQVDGDKGTQKQILDRDGYFRKGAAPYVQALGLHISADGLIYVVINERLDKEKPKRSHVSVYRLSDLDADGVPRRTEEWAAFDHPYGVGWFNHGACHLATGPDGKLYLSVGSRTDHGETGKEWSKPDPDIDTNGETPLTACMLRFDPKADKPKPEVFCRGLRNSFGYDGDDRGRLNAPETGPDANHPEELNWLREGKHFGSPTGSATRRCRCTRTPCRLPRGSRSRSRSPTWAPPRSPRARRSTRSTPTAPRRA
jgi:glucose/arabinose dehydrogenase